MRLARPRRKVGCEINITPLIDIVFLLIIFSMVVSQFSKLRAERVRLPEAQRGEEAAAAAPGHVVVNVLPDGLIVVAKQAHSPASLGAMLAAEARRLGAEALSVVVRSDRRTPWSDVARVLQACAAAGVARVKVAVVRPGETSQSP